MSIKNTTEIEKIFIETMLAELEGSENSLELLEDVKVRIEKMLHHQATYNDIIAGDELLKYCQIQLNVTIFLIINEIVKELKK